MHYKAVIISVIIIMGIFALLSERLFSSAEKQFLPQSLYDLTMNSLEGTPVDFEQFRGRNLLIVNTASKCGYTPQYGVLQELHEKHGAQVEVLGFPANNFLWQEPGSNVEIAAFCEENYGVTFRMFEKISVKGRDQHPLYRWLEAKSGKRPTWNFCKYLVNKKGEVVGFFGPKISPLDEEILKHIRN